MLDTVLFQSIIAIMVFCIISYFFNKIKSYKDMRINLIKIALIVFLYCPFISLQSKQHDDFLEYQIKAAYLYRFLSFIDWPDLTKDQNKNISICLIGEDPFGAQLDAIEGRSIGDHKIDVSRLKSKAESGKCNILFISSSEKGKLYSIFREVKNKNVLTVSDIALFTKQGGMIGFVIVDDRVRLEINLNAVRKTKINMSAKLLEVAINIYE